MTGKLTPDRAGRTAKMAKIRVTSGRLDGAAMPAPRKTKAKHETSQRCRDSTRHVLKMWGRR
jgi:hypothetical protein